MIAPFARRRATTVASTGGTSMAKFTSLFAVVRMSFVSKGSLTAVVMQYIGSAARSGLAPYCASSSAARSSASGCRRKASHGGGAPAGSGPVDGCASNAPLHVTDRSPRMLSVSSAFSCPAFGMPTRMPRWAMTLGIGHGSFHAAVVERQASVLIQVGKDRGRLDGSRGEHQRRAGSHVAGGGRDIGAVRREQRRADTVVGLRAIDVGLHDAPAGRLARRDGRVDARDGGFLHLEGRSRLGHHARRVEHSTRRWPRTASATEMPSDGSVFMRGSLHVRAATPAARPACRRSRWRSAAVSGGRSACPCSCREIRTIRPATRAPRHRPAHPG